MLLSLAFPIVLATVAVFFASFVSWMVVQLHKHDWVKLKREEAFLKAARDCELTPGNYSFPACENPAEMKSPKSQAKQAAGPCGFMTVVTKVNMGQNLALTFAYFLVVNFCLAYLATLAFPVDIRPNPGFMPIFRFVSTSAFITFLAAIVAHSIWFKCRIVGHVIESIAFAVIVGAIYAAMWPTS